MTKNETTSTDRPPGPTDRAFGLTMAVVAVLLAVVLGLLYFVVITPVALGMRLFGRDALRLRGDPQASSHWIPRDPKDQPGDRMDKPY
jgi:hypothetical protein